LPIFPKMPIENCHCERSEGTREDCHGLRPRNNPWGWIATHPSGARNDRQVNGLSFLSAFLGTH